MDLTDDTVTPEIAARVLWHFGADGGIQPGRWVGSLIALIASGDATNRARLARAYPGVTEAVRAAQYEEDGLARLQQIARTR